MMILRELQSCTVPTKLVARSRLGAGMREEVTADLPSGLFCTSREDYKLIEET